MNTSKVTAKYRSSQWMEIIRDRQNSGLNIKEYCEQTGISRHAYYYWQRKLREAACSELIKQEEPTAAVPSGWAQLAPVAVVESSLKIEVGGCHIDVNIHTDLDLLKKVCRSLRSL